MSIVEIHCFESNCSKTEGYKCYYHHNDCTSLRYLLASRESDVLSWSLEHALSVAWLLDILLADGICSILHNHKLQKVVIFFAFSPPTALSRLLALVIKIHDLGVRKNLLAHHQLFIILGLMGARLRCTKDLVIHLGANWSVGTCS